jgi:hypothetical protein
VDTNGLISTVAGTGAYGFSGDGGAATNARLGSPCAVAVDGYGNLIIADLENDRIREVDSSGNISTMAGNGQYNYSGDGGAATNASLRSPLGVAVDPKDDIFIADTFNNCIREVIGMGTNFYLNNLSASSAGNYSVVVTSFYGTVTSAVATVTVISSPQNFTAAWNAGLGVQFRFNGTPGYFYALQTATNLIGPANWQAFITNAADSNGNWTFIDSNSVASPARFYRAMLVVP